MNIQPMVGEEGVDAIVTGLLRRGSHGLLVQVLLLQGRVQPRVLCSRVGRGVGTGMAAERNAYQLHSKLNFLLTPVQRAVYGSRGMHPPQLI